MRGRPRQFNRREALDQAARLFRERGFAATTMSALSRAMGMGEQSIYNAFGNKEAVFQAALEHYCQGAQRALQDLEAGHPDPRTAIECFFTRIIEGIAADGQPCLVAQSCLNDVSQKRAIAGIINGQMERVQGAFEAAIRAGIDQGVFDCEDPAGLARYLNLTLQGLNIMARTTTSKEQLEALIARALQQL